MKAAECFDHPLTMRGYAAQCQDCGWERLSDDAEAVFQSARDHSDATGHEPLLHEIRTTKMARRVLV